jgi:hypothetical protein
MASRFKTNVKATDIDFAEKGKVRIRSVGLLNTFVQSPKDALKKLENDIGPVPLDKVSVDEHGRIVIADAPFRAKLSARIKILGQAAIAADTNYVCTNAYKCKEK